MGFISEIVATFHSAGKFPFLLGFRGFALFFAGILAVLARLCFESHIHGLVAPFNKVRSVIASFDTGGSCREDRRSTEEVLVESLRKRWRPNRPRIEFEGYRPCWLLCR